MTQGDRPSGSIDTETLFRRHASFVDRFLQRLGVAPEHRQDAIQEVFLVVHRHGGYRPGPASPTSYLASIAIHAATNERRRRATRLARHSEVDTETLATTQPDHGRALEAQQSLARVQAALEKLPEQLRVTLVLADIEDESCLSIAAAMGVPVGTVYWRLHEARKKLAAALQAAEVRDSHELNRRRVAESVLGAFVMFQDRAANTEMQRLLRLAAQDKSSAEPWVERGLDLHRQLVQSGAPLPAWAASFTPHVATWVGLIGGSGVAVIGTSVALTTTAVAILWSIGSTETTQQTPSIAPPASATSHSNSDAIEQAPVVKDVAAPDVTRSETTKAPSPAIANVAHAEVKRAVDASDTSSTTKARSTTWTRPSAATEPDETIGTVTREARAEPSAATEPAVVANVAPLPDDTREEGMVEMRTVAHAEGLLVSDPARALTLVRTLPTPLADSYFRQERAYVEIMALLRLDRESEASTRIDNFLSSYPSGPYARRIRAEIQERNGTTK